MYLHYHKQLQVDNSRHIYYFIGTNMEYVKKFNKTFKELLQDLISIFPDDSDLHMYKAVLSASIIIDETVLIQKFYHRVVVMYGNDILKKNIIFFLENQLHDVDEESNMSCFIEKMKRYYQTTLLVNKDIIWKYCKVLVLLSTKWYVQCEE